MTKTVTRSTIFASDLQQNLDNYLERAAIQAITIEQHQRPVVVLVPAGEYADLVALRARTLLDPQLKAFLDARFTRHQALAPECLDER